MGTVTCRTCNGRGRKWIDFRKGGGKWVDCRPCNGTGSNPNLWSTRCRGCRSEIIYKAYTTEPQFCKVCKNEEHEKQCAQVGCSNRIRYKLAWSNIPNYCRNCENKRKQGCSASWCPGTGFMSCGEVVWSPPGKKFTHCRKCSEKKRAEDAAKWKTKRCANPICNQEIKYNTDWSNVPDYCKNCSSKEVEKPCANARFGCDRTIKYKLSWSNVRDKCGRCHKEEQSGRTPRKCDGGCGSIIFVGNGRNFTTCRVCNDKRRAEEREQRVRSLSGRRVSSGDTSAAALAATLCYSLSQHDDVYVVEMGESARQTWGLPPLKRGTTIDGGFDRGKLPFNFPVIDQFVDGEAVSVKSLDLGSKTYRNIGSLDREIGKYIDQVSNYQGNKRSKRHPIRPDEVSHKTLLLVVRLDGSKDYQLSHLYSLKHGYAANKGVRVVIFILV